MMNSTQTRNVVPRPQMFDMLCRLVSQLALIMQKWVRQFLSWIVRAGPMPRHVAFIMDGNRRFAQEHCVSRAEGHREGYSRMIEALDWCLELGVTCVSVYAFSIENFKRSKQEVDDLMELALDKLYQILQERSVVDKHRVRVKVLGELTLLPPPLQQAAARVMRATSDNRGGVLNICFSYTSRHEIAAATQTVCESLHTGALDEADVTSGLFSRCLLTSDSPPVDLVIRTSGEMRLSDFLLLQSGFAVMEFTPVFWPDFSFFHFMKALFNYQRSFKAIQAIKASCREQKPAFCNSQHDGAGNGNVACHGTGLCRGLTAGHQPLRGAGELCCDRSETADSCGSADSRCYPWPPRVLESANAQRFIEKQDMVFKEWVYGMAGDAD